MNNVKLDNSYDSLAVAQVIGWMTVLQLTLGLLIWRFMRPLRQLFWRITRWVFFGVVILSLVSGSIYGVLEYHNGITAPEASCDYNNTLSAANSALFPIAADDSIGTAFAIDDHGTLITAYHVIEGAKEITADWVDGSEPLSIIKASPEYDLALLHYDGPTPDFLPLTTDYSVADTVYGFGWPDNNFSSGQPSITAGIISRVISGEDAHDADDTLPKDISFVQTDAALNPGDSGGALVNACGAVGVIESVSFSSLDDKQAPVRDEGIAYAVSTETIKKVFDLD
jgi:S1-C subfamily serine protease